MADALDQAAAKRNMSLRLYRRSLRSGKLLAAVGAAVLALSPLSWAGFAVNSFLSDGDLLSKVVRLQGVFLTDEYLDDFEGAACPLPSHSGPALTDFHLNQFSFLPQPILLTMAAIDVFDIPVSDYPQLFYASLPVRLDAQTLGC